MFMSDVDGTCYSNNGRERDRICSCLLWTMLIQWCWHLSQSLRKRLLTMYLCWLWHYNDVTMGAIASQITNLTIVYSIVYSDADQRKHQSSASLAFVRGIHLGPVPQMATGSYAENVSIWWRHHGAMLMQCYLYLWWWQCERLATMYKCWLWVMLMQSWWHLW